MLKCIIPNIRLSKIPLQSLLTKSLHLRQRAIFVKNLLLCIFTDLIIGLLLRDLDLPVFSLLLSVAQDNLLRLGTQDVLQCLV